MVMAMVVSDNLQTEVLMVDSCYFIAKTTEMYETFFVQCVVSVIAISLHVCLEISLAAFEIHTNLCEEILYQ
jgi:hypothetical protein